MLVYLSCSKSSTDIRLYLLENVGLRELAKSFYGKLIYFTVYISVTLITVTQLIIKNGELTNNSLIAVNSVQILSYQVNCIYLSLNVSVRIIILFKGSFSKV